MNTSQSQLLNKLSKVNYEIAIHPGTANERIASQVHNIFSLPLEGIPNQYETKFAELIEKLESTVNDLPGLMTPLKVKGIYNKTAVQYIKLLMEIQDSLED